MKECFIERCENYDTDNIYKAIGSMEPLFSTTISPGQTIVIKPNWIAPHHKYRTDEWISVITHPNFIYAIIKKTLSYMGGAGKLIITDGPQTDASFEGILSKMPVEEWKRLGKTHGVEIEIFDLRDHRWIEEDDVIISRRELPGDPLGSVEYDLGEFSEFNGHVPSSKGYYGADYDIGETNRAHSGGKHRYKISGSVISADLFINLPKLKTHKKAGITCALKNLVGVNTYKNYLPHYTEGTPAMGGDQFPQGDVKSVLEVRLLEQFKDVLFKYEAFAKHLRFVKTLGRKIFGETYNTIRGGNWYGNNTLWRMVLDLNKLVLYGNPDGTLRNNGMADQKPVLCFVDGIVSGEGNGPEAPEQAGTRVIIGGGNPVSVDCVAAKIMGFDYLKIPTLREAFEVKHFPLVNFSYDDIKVLSESISHFNRFLNQIPKEKCFAFKPHFGWTGHIEM